MAWALARVAFLIVGTCALGAVLGALTATLLDLRDALCGTPSASSAPPDQPQHHPTRAHTGPVTTGTGESPGSAGGDEYQRGRRDEYERVAVSLRRIVAAHLYSAAGRVMVSGADHGCGAIIAGYAAAIEDGRHPVLPIGRFTDTVL